MKREFNIVQGEKLSITVRSRQATYFDGIAYAVSSINGKGTFDVLPRHIHFISLIQEHIIIRKESGDTKRIAFPYGVIKVKDNKVEAYIGTGIQKK